MPNPLRFRFMPDRPLEPGQPDQLGFDAFVNVLESSLYNTQTPFVYGVLGDWGSGKTSILRLLEARLLRPAPSGEPARIVPVWFNAWLYENESNILYPLLYTFHQDFMRRVQGVDESRLRPKLARFAATCALALTDVVLRMGSKAFTGEGLKLEDLRKLQEDLRKNPEKAEPYEQVLAGWADNVRTLQEAFSALVKDYAQSLAEPRGAKTEDVRFVILIDDLDRCLPETSLKILESIKNFLSVPQCIYVLALNPAVVYQGIRAKYQGMQVNGREYLEKIINYSFYVPEPTIKLTESYARQQLRDLFVNQADYQKYQGWVDEFGHTLEQCKFNNPRKIKRILNRYLFFIAQHAHDMDKYLPGTITRLIVMAEYFPELFQILQRNPGKAMETAQGIINPKMDVSDFENSYGVKVAHIMPQLIQMKELFELRERIGIHTLAEHIVDVAAITRA